MGRKTWIRCGCGVKLHAKKKATVCYGCNNKARKLRVKEKKNV